MLAPLAAKGVGKLATGAKDAVGKGVSKGVDKTVDKAGGAGGIAKKAAKDAIPGMGGGDDGGNGGQKNEAEGAGKGRRMPIQQAVDIGAPLSTVYNEWTQFEEWPKFMHRLQSVSQEDETHVAFKTKIWGISKEFKAEIVEQRPDERIKWKVTDGVTHTGVVTFHELAENLTHVEVNLDVDPGSLIEKAGRGMRHVKRAVRGDLARFKAYVMMNEEEDGAWRGRIEDGKVKKQRSSSSSRRRSSASSRSRSSGSSSKSRSSGSSSKSRSSGSSSKSSGSSSRPRSSSSRSKGSSNGSSGGGSRTTAKSRSSSSNGRSSGSRSGSSRKKSGARS
ncbi:MAG TPA: SRPBCC family protein [Thermoleophilaceae bacterium]|nr:SRPBCC family protein [Thermoleophilaceae bacterium]